jgi:hypothetical protein
LKANMEINIEIYDGQVFLCWVGIEGHASKFL